MIKQNNKTGKWLHKKADNDLEQKKIDNKNYSEIKDLLFEIDGSIGKLLNKSTSIKDEEILNLVKELAKQNSLIFENAQSKSHYMGI